VRQLLLCRMQAGLAREPEVRVGDLAVNVDLELLRGCVPDADGPRALVERVGLPVAGVDVPRVVITGQPAPGYDVDHTGGAQRRIHMSRGLRLRR
jgi:hypothetical protein